VTVIGIDLVPWLVGELAAVADDHPLFDVLIKLVESLDGEPFLMAYEFIEDCEPSGALSEPCRRSAVRRRRTRPRGSSRPGMRRRCRCSPFTPPRPGMGSICSTAGRP
jgi:hypothetical protein